jgi:hypothetical protein
MEAYVLNTKAKTRIRDLVNAPENQGVDFSILAPEVAGKEEYGNLTTEQVEDAMFRVSLGVY